MVDLYDEATDLLDTEEAASAETETVLRANPVTGLPAYAWDYEHGAPQDTLQDELVDLTFQRPEELGLGEEDSQDLPFGSVLNPASDPDFSEPTIGPDPWENTPEWVEQIINRMNLWEWALVGAALYLLLPPLVRGAAEGATSN